ncbi:MAG: hypothetical protein ISS71_01705 [Phycisphaerae bacterium]|nr:hypothetical protein [Phycisphaerae bacterium]
MKSRMLFVFVLVIIFSAQGVIIISDEFTVDFTDPNAIREHTVTWTPQKKVQQTDEGLVFPNPSNATSVDFGLLTKPYAIGLSWRPTYGATLGVELTPLGEETKFSGGTLHPSFYSVYVRYSPDLKNWSSWHALQDKHPDWQARKKAGIHQFYIQLQVPHKERQKYNDYFSQYLKMDVPWQSDEEAMVKWMLTKEPDFFKKHIPFIGYIQFLCEASMWANQPLSQMKISIGWGVGGLHSLPKDESVYKNRDNIPWRYKSPDTDLPP